MRCSVCGKETNAPDICDKCYVRIIGDPPEWYDEEPEDDDDRRDT